MFSAQWFMFVNIPCSAAHLKDKSSAILIQMFPVQAHNCCVHFPVIYEIKVISVLTHWGRDKMAAISQTTSWNAFSWMKIYEFRTQFITDAYMRHSATMI